MIRGLFLGDYLHPRGSSTTITLLPKVGNPKSLTDFRPISLCMFSSKLIFKILASRLSQILPQLINEQQYRFVKGSSIHESIALAQEMIADLDRRSEGGNIIFKYDMSKVYDRVEWRFLLRAMRDLHMILYIAALVISVIGSASRVFTVKNLGLLEGSGKGIRSHLCC